MIDIINKHKSIIILNGQLPPQTVIKKINTNVVKISADGAGLYLNPDHILGDMDSTKFNINNEKYLKIDDQSTTDFEKCLNFVENKKLSPSLIIGIAGGELDHTLNNLMILANSNLPMYFIDYANTNNIKFGMALRNKLKMQLPINSTISILPFFSAKVSTSGLRWELKKSKLQHNGLRSPRNRNIQENIEVNLHEGIAIFIAEIKDIIT